MQTFTQALIEHVLAGHVDREIAANAATNRHDFLVALEHALKRQAAEAAAEAAASAEEPAAPGPETTIEAMPGLRVVRPA